MLIVSKNSISDVSKIAHLCPPILIGKKSCCVNRLMNQFWRVSSRLFNHREEGVG